MSSKKYAPTVLSGMRSTGDLHLGHYFGVIDNWLKLEKEYPCYIFAADWHALTTDYKNPEIIAKARKNNILDWIACGLDPEKSVLYIQSDIKEIAELNLLFSMITPLGWLERNPTYKDQQAQLAATQTPTEKDTNCLGFLGYPVLQAADIAIVQGTLVPVGEDQIPHIEMNREMVRRFTHLYKKDIFPEPKPLLTEVPKLLGTDNRKMSKSYNNAIMLSDSTETVTKRVKSMVTDPSRVHRDDPGHPEICNVFSYHKFLEGNPTTKGRSVTEIEPACKAGSLSCGDCKVDLASKLNGLMDPIRNRRAELTKNPKLVDDITAEGAAKVRKIASRVIGEAREAMKL